MRYYRGITIAEILVVIAIFGGIIAAVGAFGGDIFKLSARTKTSLSSTQDARNLLRVMAKELRSSSTGADGSYALAVVSSSTITFFSDIDADGQKDMVKYYVNSSSTLMKSVITPPYLSSTEKLYILAYNVKNATTSIFTYYDTNYTGTSSPLTFPINIPLVRLVKIDLLLNDKWFTTQVSLRNLKDNL